MWWTSPKVCSVLGRNGWVCRTLNREALFVWRLIHSGEIKIFIMNRSCLRRSGTARANEGSRSFTCHSHVYPQVDERYGTCLYSPVAQRHRTLAGKHFRPAEGRRLSWPGWLGEILSWFGGSQMVIHPNISWLRRPVVGHRSLAGVLSLDPALGL